MEWVIYVAAAVAALGLVVVLLSRSKRRDRSPMSKSRGGSERRDSTGNKAERDEVLAILDNPGPAGPAEETGAAPPADIPSDGRTKSPPQAPGNAAPGPQPLRVPEAAPRGDGQGKGVAAAARASAPQADRDALKGLAARLAGSGAETEDYLVQRIFYGTDRKWDDMDGTGPSFGHGRADHLTLGTADVTIPRNAHKLGHLERPKELTLFTITLWRQREDPAKHFTLLSTSIMSPEDFKALAAKAAAGAVNYAASAFVFIHGFNTTFRDAMFRAAQMAHDLQFDGPAFAYSWPSVGETLDYVTDMDSADNAAGFIDEFLDLVLSVPGIDKLHLVAHSMGNAALAELLTRAGTRLAARQGKGIDQMILAAPDLDAGEFRNIAHFFTGAARGVTLYACASDRALLASQKIRNNFVRAGGVGADGPVVVPGIDTIDVTAVGTELFSLNHGVYAKDRGVLDDLGLLFRTGLRPPGQRMPTLREVVRDPGSYWIMPR